MDIISKLVKPGVKTTEFWVGIVATLLVTFCPEFPKEAFLTVIAWIGARTAQKAFGFVDPQTGKNALKTSEFWIAIGFAAIKSAFPDIPQESLMYVLTWILGRTGVKVLADFNVPKT